MTRDQALAIINNIAVIEAFAKGREISCIINGRKFPTNSLCLSNFRSDSPIGYSITDEPNSFFNEQIKKAQDEVSHWDEVKRKSVQLEGSE